MNYELLNLNPFVADKAGTEGFTMRWKYYIPHPWDSPEEKTTWEYVTSCCRTCERSAASTASWLVFLAVRKKKKVPDVKGSAQPWTRGADEAAGGRMADQTKSPQAHREELLDWLRFIRADTHIPRENPRLFFQQAANQPTQLLRLKSLSGDFEPAWTSALGCAG